MSQEDVGSRVKPDPLAYEIAARRLDARPSQCLAFEDAPPGIRAARLAGIFCVAVASRVFSPQDQAEADLLVPSLSDLELLPSGPSLGLRLLRDP